MKIRFIGQPVQDQLGSQLRELLADDSTNSFWALTAWAKASGLRRLGGAMQEAVARGAEVEVVAGVDEGGASIEGLRALIDVTTAAYVFHNPGRPKRTFHPKLYVVQRSASTEIFVGSGNLTNGGLFTNYEAFTHLSIDLIADTPDQQYLDDIRAYYESLRDDPASCRRLDTDLIDEMRRDPSLIITSERSRRTSGRSLSEQASEVDLAAAFSASATILLNAPTASLGIAWDSFQPGAEEEESDDSISLTAAEADAVEFEATTDFGPVESVFQPTNETPRPFYKQLSTSDVSLTSSPGQIIIPIRFRNFFGELTQDHDGSLDGGPSQWSRLFRGVFVDGSTVIELDDARVIVYEPAASHARTNTEVRFTFRNREVLTRLTKGDYLTFAWDQGNLRIVRQTEAPGSRRFGWI